MGLGNAGPLKGSQVPPSFSEPKKPISFGIRFMHDAPVVYWILWLFDVVDGVQNI
jgi:hypothetical protein